jgi:hypothetical protein
VTIDRNAISVGSLHDEPDERVPPFRIEIMTAISGI